MNKKEREKFNKLIEDLEVFKEQLKQSSEELEEKIQRFYFKGAWINVDYCIKKLKSF